MSAPLFKNDFKIHKDLRDFANHTALGKFLKPIGKQLYRALKPHLPYPRDFLLRRMVKGGIGCEVGVYDGVFSERIMKIVQPKKLYLVDPWTAERTTGSKFDEQVSHDNRYERVTKKFANSISNGVITIMRTTSDEAVRQFLKEYFDFVYLDGDHSYEQVAADLRHYYPTVKRGGLLCGDDYGEHEGVVRAVDEFAQQTGLSVEVRLQQFIFRKPTTRTN